MQTPEQVKWDIFERCVKKDTVNGKDKSRTGNVEHFGSPAECVSHFLNLLRGHKHSKSCKCENTWEIEGDKLVFKKVCRKKLQANMKSKLGLKEDQEVPPHLVRTQKTPHVFALLVAYYIHQNAFCQFGTPDTKSLVYARTNQYGNDTCWW